MDILKSLDIALSMSVIYLLFALSVTAFNEFIAAALSSRARWMRKGVQALITPAPAKADGQVQEAKALDADAVYNSPLISALGRASGVKWQPRFAPSYIEAWTLVQGMLDAAATTGGKAFSTFEQVTAAVKALPDRSPIKVVLDDLIIQADSDLAKLKALVDAWFKTFDEQVIAWYRQKTQYVLVALSVLLAVGLNLDTAAMVRVLSANSKTLEAMVEQALDVGKMDNTDALVNPKPLQQARKELEQLKKEGKTGDALKAAEDKVATEMKGLEKSASDMVSGLAATGLPIGWNQVDFTGMGFSAWLTKVLGLLTTACALSLGAPVWFDMLKKLSSIRSVGKNLLERQQDAAMVKTI